jgi:hypothetical protein
LHPLDDVTEFQCFILYLLSVSHFLVTPHVGAMPGPCIRGSLGWGRAAYGRIGCVVIGHVPPIPRLEKLERHVVWRGAANHELSKMDCLVVEIANGDHIPQLVTSTPALVFDVM